MDGDVKAMTDLSALAGRPSARFWYAHAEHKALWRVLWKTGRTGWRSAGGKRAVRRWRAQNRMRGLERRGAL